MSIPRLADVAARAGVSLSTASAALNGLALVRAATRRRVEEAARQLGYHKEASAAVLAAHRKRARSQPRKLSLGYLISPTAAHKHSEAFERHAHRLGYGVEWVDLRTFSSPASASQTLWNRNVAGLFYASPGAVPEKSGWATQFDWSRFAVIKFTRARPELRFDLIRHSAFDFASRAIREVVQHGYRRIAVLFSSSGVAEDDEARLGAVLGWQALRGPPSIRIEWRLIGGDGSPQGHLPSAIHAWLRRFRPGVVLGFPDSIFWQLRLAGWSIPQDFAYAAVARGADLPDVAGSWASHDQLVAKAVELLDRQIKLGVRGPVDLPEETVIEPEWTEGSSLPVCPLAGSTTGQATLG